MTHTNARGRLFGPREPEPTVSEVLRRLEANPRATARPFSTHPDAAVDMEDEENRSAEEWIYHNRHSEDTTYPRVAVRDFPGVLSQYFSRLKRHSPRHTLADVFRGLAKCGALVVNYQRTVRLYQELAAIDIVDINPLDRPHAFDDFLDGMYIPELRVLPKRVDFTLDPGTAEEAEELAMLLSVPKSAVVRLFIVAGLSRSRIVVPEPIAEMCFAEVKAWDETLFEELKRRLRRLEQSRGWRAGLERHVPPDICGGS